MQAIFYTQTNMANQAALSPRRRTPGSRRQLPENFDAGISATSGKLRCRLLGNIRKTSTLDLRLFPETHCAPHGRTPYVSLSLDFKVINLQGEIMMYVRSGINFKPTFIICQKNMPSTCLHMISVTFYDIRLTFYE